MKEVLEQEIVVAVIKMSYGFHEFYQFFHNSKKQST